MYRQGIISKLPQSNAPSEKPTVRQNATQSVARHSAIPSETSKNQSSRQSMKPEPVRNVVHKGVQLAQGSRVDITSMAKEKLTVRLSYAKKVKPVDVDAYAFLLGNNRKVSEDGDLIFFDNPCHDSSIAKLSADNTFPGIEIDLPRMPSGKERIAICFSAYGDDV